MRRVKCAVIGAGWWGTTAHVPALVQHPDADLIAVLCRDISQAQKVASDFGVPHAFDDIDELLALDGLEAVAISSTPQLHYAHAKASLRRGLHVLIKKPMTMTAAEARELVTLAEQQNVQFVISAPWHYTRHGREAQSLIEQGKLGRIKMISVLMTNFTLGLYEGKPWQEVFGRNPTLQNSADPYMTPGQTSYSDPAIAGGGQIYCQVSHAAAYLSYLTGAHPVEVFARFVNADAAVDVYDTLNIKLDNGAIVSLGSTGATMLSDRHYEVRVYGADGMLLLELWKGTMEFHDIDCHVTRYADLSADEVYPMYEPAKNLIDCILGNAPNKSPATLGVDAMKITSGAVESVRLNQNIVVA